MQNLAMTTTRRIALSVLLFLCVTAPASANTREPWMDPDDEVTVSCEPTPEMTREECLNILHSRHRKAEARQAEYQRLPWHEKTLGLVLGLAVVFVGIPWLLANLFEFGNKK